MNGRIVFIQVYKTGGDHKSLFFRCNKEFNTSNIDWVDNLEYTSIHWENTNRFYLMYRYLTTPDKKTFTTQSSLKRLNGIKQPLEVYYMYRFMKLGKFVEILEKRL